jgi:hypothetical protein
MQNLRDHDEDFLRLQAAAAVTKDPPAVISILREAAAKLDAFDFAVICNAVFVHEMPFPIEALQKLNELEED